MRPRGVLNLPGARCAAGHTLHHVNPIQCSIWPPSKRGGMARATSWLAHNYLSTYFSALWCQYDYFTAPVRNHVWYLRHPTSGAIANENEQTGEASAVSGCIHLQWLTWLRPYRVLSQDHTLTLLLLFCFSVQHTQRKSGRPADDTDGPPICFSSEVTFDNISRSARSRVLGIVIANGRRVVSRSNRIV